ncbi:signal transduction histidine kinase [Thiovulum sp. ES]|nr:signal transduction histidine kinase [Thiovulum sp. ES]
MNNIIYIADDDKNLLNLYSSIFSSEESDELDFFSDETDSEEFSIKLFEDGYFLVEEFEKAYQRGEKIPIVILDMRMPKMSGFETAKKVRDIDENVIVIIITAYSDVSMSEIRFQLKNGIYYFKKPFNEDELYSLVDSALKQWNHLQEIIQLKDALNKNNIFLEDRVKEEVEKSRDKDRIIARQQRLSYIGEVLSSVAHHWRQPLNQLTLLIEDLNDGYKYGDLNQEYFEKNSEDMVKIVNYMSKTIDNFRDFFAPNEQETIFPVAEAIENALELYDLSIKHDSINIELDVDSNLKIKGFVNEFSRVVVSLVENSHDAILRNNIELPKIKISVTQKNDLVNVKIIDNAGGVSEEFIEKVFDPYSTIKNQTKGTGLGLFFCKVVVESHMNGNIGIENFENGIAVEMSFMEQKD